MGYHQVKIPNDPGSNQPAITDTFGTNSAANKFTRFKILQKLDLISACFIYGPTVINILSDTFNNFFRSKVVCLHVYFFLFCSY